MFERLLELVIQGWALMRPFFIVDAYELAGVLRFGQWSRECAPGFHWKIPFVERPITVIACVTTMRLPAQALTTRDDVPVTVAAIVKYQITSVETYMVGIFDQHDVLCDVTMGAIRKALAGADYADLVKNPPEKEVATALRAEVNRYGFKIHAVTFTQFTRARPLMLIQQSVLKDLDN